MLKPSWLPREQTLERFGPWVIVSWPEVGGHGVASCTSPGLQWHLTLVLEPTLSQGHWMHHWTWLRTPSEGIFLPWKMLPDVYFPSSCQRLQAPQADKSWAEGRDAAQPWARANMMHVPIVIMRLG